MTGRTLDWVGGYRCRGDEPPRTYLVTRNDDCHLLLIEGTMMGLGRSGRVHPDFSSLVLDIRLLDIRHLVLELGVLESIDGGFIKVVEPRVIEGLLGTEAAGRVVFEQTGKEIESVFVEGGEVLVERLRLPLRTIVPVTETGNSRPHLLRRSPEELEYMEQLLPLTVTGEERCLPHQFRHNATNTPHVDRTSVVGSSEENLGSTVPECHDLVRVRLDGDRELPAKAEIRNLANHLRRRVLIDQHVLRLEIPVHDPMAVHMRHSLEHLVGKTLDQFRVERIVRSFAVTIHVLL